MIDRAVNLLFVAAVFVVACAAQVHTEIEPSPEVEATLAKMLTDGGLILSRLAKHQSDSAWLWSAKHRKETAMCAASGTYAYGVAMNGKAFVIVGEFVPANILKQDSLYVIWGKGLCGDSLPSWHSHIVDNSLRYSPSPCDLHTATKYPNIPFHFQVGDTNRIKVYMRNDQYASDAIAWCGLPTQNGMSEHQ
jgi:hypothetical protein